MRPLANDILDTHSTPYVLSHIVHRDGMLHAASYYVFHLTVNQGILSYLYIMVFTIGNIAVMLAAPVRPHFSRIYSLS
jgi:hypothetical protein